MEPLLTAENIKEPYNEPRQKLPQTYWQTGTLDMMRRQTLLDKKSMTGEFVLPYVIDNRYVADIDDQDSFDRAAAIIRHTNCVKFDD